MLVDSLIDAVRQQIDETNPEDISEVTVLAALNRARIKLLRLSSRKFASMFREAQNVTADGLSREVTIPALAFGLVVNEVSVIRGGVAYRVDPAEQSDIINYDIDSSTTAIPLYYTQQGNKLLLYPRPHGGTEIRIRYQQRAPELVRAQGRINTIDSAGNQVYLDAVGDDLTTSITSLGAFVNWVDANTGVVRATLQVSAIDPDNLLVTFKSVGLDRSVVFGQTVSAAVPADGAQDDFLCLASGTCVPTLVQDYADYMVQFAVVELKRKADMPVADDKQALNELEDDIRSMWSGRQSGRRVKRAGSYWGGAAAPLITRYR